VAVTLAVGLLKGDAMSHVIRDATMLGAAAIVPFVSDHVALPERAWRARHLERWTRVAVASARQCGRAVVPRLNEVSGFNAVLAAPTDERVMCVEPSAIDGGEDAAADRLPDPPGPARATVLVGPEGGWSAGEVERARGLGVSSLSLGPRTLRAEMAPAVALTVLWTRWGWR
jgi:16S rRNA (uracil1498-N3)-methyltransferase